MFWWLCVRNGQFFGGAGGCDVKESVQFNSCVWHENKTFSVVIKKFCRALALSTWFGVLWIVIANSGAWCFLGAKRK